jgi:hypothetical protein
MDAIPRDMAQELCGKIREENRGKWYRFEWWQCWGCVKFSKGDPGKMCFSNREGCRGCNLVSKRYDGLNL